MNIKKILKFIICIFGPIILGTIVAFAIDTKNYNVLNKPLLSPPKIVFPIAWSILYLLMGISFYIVIKNNNDFKSIFYFVTQLFINLMWSFFFFDFKLYYFAAIWLVLLIYFVILMILRFKSIKKVAANLQLPYFAWLLFALYLNIGVALLN